MFTRLSVSINLFSACREIEPITRPLMQRSALLTLFKHARMSVLRPLSEERKSDFGAVRSVVDRYCRKSPKLLCD